MKLGVGVAALAITIALSGCTQGSSGQPAPLPTATGAPEQANPSASAGSPGESPSASTEAPTPDSSEPVDSSPSATPLETSPPAAGLIALLTYHSGQRAPSADFTVTDGGYKVTYTCEGELPAGATSPIGASYELTGEKATSATVQLKCDGQEHTAEYHPNVDPNYDQRTVTLTGDKQGVDYIALRVQALASDSD